MPSIVDRRPLSAIALILRSVEVSAEAVARVPGENLRVSRAEFGAVWALSERLGTRPATGDKYLVGVITTCRWLACQPVWSSVIGRWEVPAAPLSRRGHAAMPETIDEEYLAAVCAAGFERERARGVMATLEWCWHGSGRPPLDMPSTAG